MAATLYERHFVDAGQLSATSQHSVRFAQFNTLAHWLCDEKAFPYAAAHILPWESRRDRIVAEITRIDAAFVGLEEVDHFDFFQQHLAGYEGFHEPKKGSADGPCIFYKSALYTLHRKEVVSPLVDGNSQLLLAGVFVPNAAPILNDHALPAGSLIFACTHLKAKPPFEAVRVEQAMVIAERLTALSREYSGLPVVLSGDLNTEPGSDTYRLLIRNHFRSAYANYRLPSGTAPPTDIEQLVHGEFEPAYTTFKKRDHEVCHTIDFILYLGGAVTPTRLFSIPQKADGETLPSELYPSDHFAIAAELALLM
eukprot:TRINITY_DN14550_c0_g1_i1.p1 TRINITY_DN14550_c0_g1~~TRINITY_DN14550_c0_g1_i1.p1  ORF type:complete len:331 (+),score=57.15 TRINITY_DN14550_c0_g1_i1:64-993(+)